MSREQREGLQNCGAGIINVVMISVNDYLIRIEAVDLHTFLYERV